MDKRELTTFYTYVLLDARHPGKFVYEKEENKIEFDYEPYYIGKGGTNTTIRPQGHLYEALKTKKKNHKLNLIRKLVEEKLEFKYEYLIKDVSEKEAFEWEIFYIKLIGREDLGKGPLTNLTDGGEGTMNISPETRKRLSIINMGENNPMYGKHFSEEANEKRNKTWKENRKNGYVSPNKGKKHSKEVNSKKNHAKGKMWINNGIKEFCIFPEELDMYLNDNFEIGMFKKIKCEWCKKENTKVNHTRYHGDKCRLKPGNENIKYKRRKNKNKVIFKKIECPYCKRLISENNFSRSHGENCKCKQGNENNIRKTKRKTCEYCGRDLGMSAYTTYHGDKCKLKPGNENIEIIKPRKKYECTHCHRFFSLAMLKRWHNDKCNLK